MEHKDWIDRWKGLLITLVVAGHVFGGACHLCGGVSQALMEYLYKFIYMFHMPAFFWLAGRCWSPKSDFRAFVANKARRLLVPYAIFGVLSVVAYLFLMRGSSLFASSTTGYYQDKGVGAFWQPFVSLLHAGGWPNGEGFRCNSVLWFLPAMFSVLCFYWMVDRWLKSRWTQFILACFLFMMEFVRRRWLGYSLPFGLSLLPWYAGFLILGRWIRLDNFNAHGLLVALGWIVFGVLAYVEPNYWAGQIDPLWYFVFLLMAIVGVVGSMLTAKLFSSSILIELGKASLGIMLMHKFVVLFLQVKLPFVARLGQTSAGLFVVANLMIVFLAVAVSWGATALIRIWTPWALGEKRRMKAVE